MSFSKSLMVAAMAVMLPSFASAAVVFDLTLTDASNPAYSGVGQLSLASAPTASGVTNYTAAQVSGLTFTVAGQTFTASPGSVSAVQFLNGALNDITFAQEIGASPNRYALHTTSGYAFYYNNEQSAAYGTITARPATMAAAVPEPSAWLLMVTGIGIMGAVMRRRTALNRAGKSIAGVN
jgi:hypothetical protein